MSDLINLEDALLLIKTSIEKAIIKKGSVGKNNLIRSQKPIKLLHDVVKSELIKKNVNGTLIKPPLNESKGELSLSGFFKRKNQDVCIIPNDIIQSEERLDFEGILKGITDKYGFQYTEKILSINIRSQLSSAAKNFDTLYERTFAEALNLHLRCPSMVLGEFYMIPVREYDSEAANHRKIKFKQENNIANHIEKYLYAFNAINKRTTINNDHYKYERVCLLIVDFSRDIPKIYNNDEELKIDGLLSIHSQATLRDMDFTSFVDDLLSMYSARFGDDKFN